VAGSSPTLSISPRLEFGDPPPTSVNLHSITKGAEPECNGINLSGTRYAHKTGGSPRGTKGSNPAPSSAESATNLVAAGAVARGWDPEFESALLQQGVSCEPDFLDHAVAGGPRGFESCFLQRGDMQTCPYRFAQVDDRDYGFEVRLVGQLGCPPVAVQSAQYADFVSLNLGLGCVRRAIFLPHPASEMLTPPKGVGKSRGRGLSITATGTDQILRRKSFIHGFFAAEGEQSWENRKRPSRRWMAGSTASWQRNCVKLHANLARRERGRKY